MLTNKNRLFIVLLFTNILLINGQKKPNILWLVCEDQSLFFSIYGDSTVQTPNIEQLANDGLIYENCFTTSPVCSPSRSSLITGMYPTTIGTQHMRAYKKNQQNTLNKHNQLPYYSPVAKKEYKFFTEILRANGYYCTNNSKEDYNMMKSPLAWDESSDKAHWRNRNKNQPFFSVFNFNITHESRIWKNNKIHEKNEIDKISLPIIFPENFQIKNDFLTNYKNIESLDKQIGKIIQQLKDDGLYENTVIFFYSDHGGPFPRYKRSIYDTGIQCPLVIKWIEKKSSDRNDQMVSFIDFAPTLIDLAALKIPDYLEGVSLYNKDQRNYIYASSDRFDEFSDSRKCVRNKKFKLILNLDTISPIGKPVNYRKQMKTMEVIDSLNDNSILNGYFNSWYQSGKEKYEFYNISNDPLELVNLINDSTYLKDISKLKTQLHTWIEASDYGSMSEEKMIEEMFSDEFRPLKLNVPTIKKSNEGFIIYSNNSGASIGYRTNKSLSWKIIKNGDQIVSENAFELLMFKPGYELFIETFE